MQYRSCYILTYESHTWKPSGKGIPDVLEDVWIDVANGEMEAAKERIEKMPSTQPFELKYNADIGGIDWESCSDILSQKDIMKELSKGWED